MAAPVLRSARRWLLVCAAIYALAMGFWWLVHRPRTQLTAANSPADDARGHPRARPGLHTDEEPPPAPAEHVDVDMTGWEHQAASSPGRARGWRVSRKCAAWQWSLLQMVSSAASGRSVVVLSPPPQQVSDNSERAGESVRMQVGILGRQAVASQVSTAVMTRRVLEAVCAGAAARVSGARIVGIVARERSIVPGREWLNVDAQVRAEDTSAGPDIRAVEAICTAMQESIAGEPPVLGLVAVLAESGNTGPCEIGLSVVFEGLGVWSFVEAEGDAGSWEARKSVLPYGSLSPGVLVAEQGAAGDEWVLAAEAMVGQQTRSSIGQKVMQVVLAWPEQAGAQSDDASVRWQRRRFVACDVQAVGQFRLVHGPPAHQVLRASSGTEAGPDAARVFAQSVRQVLLDARPRLRQAGVAWWLNSGTLLGWRRECSVMGHDRDIDVGVRMEPLGNSVEHDGWQEEVAAAVEAAMLASGGEPMATESPFRRAHRLGLAEWGLQLSWRHTNGLKLDMFFFYSERDATGRVVREWNGATQVKSGLRFRYDFFPVQVCQGELLGVPVQVPCDSDRHVEANYGPSWRTPQRSWDWKHSASNVHGLPAWSREQLAKAIQIP
jgi:hypothetical protein